MKIMREIINVVDDGALTEVYYLVRIFSARQNSVTGTWTPPPPWSGTLNANPCERRLDLFPYMILPRVPRWPCHVQGSHSSPQTSGGDEDLGSRMASRYKPQLLLSWVRCTRFHWTWNTSDYIWRLQWRAWLPGRTPSVLCCLAVCWRNNPESRRQRWRLRMFYWLNFHTVWQTSVTNLWISS